MNETETEIINTFKELKWLLETHTPETINQYLLWEWYSSFYGMIVGILLSIILFLIVLILIKLYGIKIERGWEHEYIHPALIFIIVLSIFIFTSAMIIIQKYINMKQVEIAPNVLIVEKIEDILKP